MKKYNENIGSILAAPKYTECYTNLAKDRIIFISEVITKEVASSLSALLMYYDNQSEEDISLYINTDGGDGTALSNIYDIMQMIKSPIKTICIGKAYSAGAFMLAAGSKGKRFITKHSTVMVHGIQTIYPLPGSDQKKSEIWYEHIKIFNKSILEILASHTGKSIEQVQDFCKKDNYLSAEEALEYGIVDQII